MEKDVKHMTTYQLEWIINNFTWFENGLLSRAKRELDKRYRMRTLQRQKENLFRDIENNLKKSEEKFGD